MEETGAQEDGTPPTGRRADAKQRKRDDECRTQPCVKRRKATAVLLADESQLGLLPDELLLVVARYSLSACLCLRRTSNGFAQRLLPILLEAKRLCWAKFCMINDTDFVQITPHHGLTLYGHNHDEWCAGSLLPSSGQTAWRCNIVRSMHNIGMVYIGVCDENNTCAWSLLPRQGHLRRWSRNAVTNVIGGAPKPAGYPNGHLTHILVTREGDRYDLRGRAEGTVIDVIYDADAGSLAFRIDCGPLLLAVAGFPRGVAMRPWARVVDPWDIITASPCNP